MIITINHSDKSLLGFMMLIFKSKKLGFWIIHRGVDDIACFFRLVCLVALLLNFNCEIVFVCFAVGFSMSLRRV